MDHEELKREIKGDIEGLKKHLDTLENDDLIRIYEKEILLKSLELEDWVSLSNINCTPPNTDTSFKMIL